jgi:hypothetical protein
MNANQRDAWRLGVGAAGVVVLFVLAGASCETRPLEPPLVREVKPIVIEKAVPVPCFDLRDLPPEPVSPMKKGAGLGRNAAGASVDVRELVAENKTLRALLTQCANAVKP